MDVCPAVVADEEASALVEPGEAALDDPAFAAQTGAVLGQAARDQRSNAAFADEPAVLVVVVAAVAQKHVGPPSGSARPAADGRHPVEQGRQHEGVVAVRACQQPGQRHSGGIGQEVVLAARPAPVDGARPDLAAPFFA